jgi:hypothetical protein
MFANKGKTSIIFSFVLCVPFVEKFLRAIQIFFVLPAPGKERTSACAHASGRFVSPGQKQIIRRHRYYRKQRRAAFLYGFQIRLPAETAWGGGAIATYAENQALNDFTLPQYRKDCLEDFPCGLMTPDLHLWILLASQEKAMLPSTRWTAVPIPPPNRELRPA